jgi:hypothetical protein
MIDLKGHWNEKSVSFTTHCFLHWQVADHRIGFWVSTCLSCQGADRRRKIGGHTVPVAAACQNVIFRWQTANQAWVYRLGINKKKVEPHTGYQINLWSGATGKKIFSNRWNEHFKNRSFETDDQKIFKYSSGSYWRPKASANMFIWSIFCVNVPLKRKMFCQM